MPSPQRRRHILQRERPQFGTPVHLAATYSTANANTASYALTAGQDRAVGDAVVVSVEWFRNDGTISSVTDSAGNTYTANSQTDVEGAIGQIRQFSSILVNPLPEGGSITANFSLTNTTPKAMLIAAVSGVVARDKNLAGVTGTSASPAIATGTLAEPDEIALATVYNAAVGFASIPAAWVEISTSGSPAFRGMYYKIATSREDTTPTWGLNSSALWAAHLVSFTKVS